MEQNVAAWSSMVTSWLVGSGSGWSIGYCTGRMHSRVPVVVGGSSSSGSAVPLSVPPLSKMISVI